MKLYTLTVLAKVVVMAEDADHARDLMKDVLEDSDRLAAVKLLYCRPKEEEDHNG